MARGKFGVNRRREIERELDYIVPRIVKLMGSSFGFNNCYTCGKVVNIDKLDWGHHFSRKKSQAVRWHLMNSKPQCRACNSRNNGEFEKFKSKLIEDYGQDKYDGLEMLANGVHKFSLDELEEMLDEYTEMLAELESHI